MEPDVGNLMSLAVHGVLFHREIYAKETFRRSICWGTSVWLSRHEGLCGYIDKYVNCAKGWHAKGKLAEFRVVVDVPDAVAPVEEFTLRFKSSRGDANAQLVSVGQFRTLFERLAATEYPNLASDATFSIRLVLENVDRDEYYDDWCEEFAEERNVRRVFDCLSTIRVSNSQVLEALYTRHIV